ncbi:HsmA family protein [Clostridium algidicarnis]|uniref:TIGR03987 family protein n=2 Tax=Clostridium algidicarnis TaxID=37659 RepID=A0ABS6C1R4_9CLOT|nr:HsmA family protein [Clostridium algidicarnis]MBB6631323.1 TIGR03987 family protein [Clostridium algidicarnis]MBB6697200.1 TIGR03987 family protein [Clostridium algidicarnis]MBU3192381.1 TIGR03987 family protein [Clostridium algidicarnis]MBU3204471.1 TIGR03987 family protein [Clostridium algidicarnis]MBU3206401.1 TIGR03987 family protein [Clostridium algidicarnis]
MLVAAIISISLALVCYTIGVWSEKIQGKLKTWHLSFFWIGFVFDTIGTTLMKKLSGSTSFNLHSVTGGSALALMLIHAIWATVVIYKKREKGAKSFHKFSLVVWVIWLIPYITGMVIAMKR